MGAPLLNQMIIILLLTMTGYILRKKNVSNDAMQTGLSSLVIKVSVPAIILAAANKPFEKSSLIAIGTILLGALIFHIFALAFSGFIGKKVLHLSDDKNTIFRLLTTFSNASFLGYPIISIFLPENGVFYASFYVVIFNILFFSFGTAKLSGGKKRSFKAIFGNLPTIASLVMLVLYLFQIKLPVPVQDTLQILGGLSTPLSLIVVGSMLGGIQMKELFTDKSVYVSSFLRLILLPSLVFVVLKLLKLPIETATTLMVMTFLPCANTTAIAAQVYKCEPIYATKGVLQSTLFFGMSVAFGAFLVAQL